MTLASTISGANLTKIRSNSYRSRQFVAAVPDVVVVQFQASVEPSDSVYAEVTVGTVASGSMSDIKSLQTVIYSTTTDYGATETYKTYVRKVSGTTTLYIGQNGQSLSTSMYVTVLNTYEVFEKPRTVRNGVEYSDWDITYRRLLPVESALPTAIVLIDGATAWSPTASPQEIDNDATSTFTHAWESSNSNDTLDSGGTTASPVWTLEADAHRWIRYTFTDSNGNANVRVITIWTVPKSLASVVNLGFIGRDNTVADIQYQQGTGWTCTIPAFADIDSLRAETMICVFSIEEYNGTRTPIESNIDFIGYLGNEQTTTAGSNQYGRISETRFTVDGFGAKLALTPVSTLSVTESTGPSAWGEVENPTPVRMLVYVLSEHTTFLNLCAFNFPSNHTDFIAPGVIFTSESDVAADAAQYQADAMGGIIQFGRDGIYDMTLNLVESDDTDRNAADTVAAMTPSDWLDYVIELQPVPIMRFLEIYAGAYDTSTLQYTVYQSFTPPVPDIRGTVTEQRVNMILTTDLTDANAQLEFAERSANLYAALNPTDILRITLNDEWRFLQPDVGAWYTFTVALTDTIRGVSYDSNTRWQLIQISYNSNNETGRKQVNAVFRKETQSTGANIEVNQLQNADINAVPGVLPPFTGSDLGLTDGNWFDAFDPSPPTDPDPPDAGCDLVGFRPKDGLGVSTPTSALLSEKVGMSISGSGVIQEGSSGDDDLISASGSWTAQGVGDDFAGSTISSGTAGSWSSGWGHGDVRRTDDNSYHRVVDIILDLGEIKTITDFEVTFNLTKGSMLNISTCYNVSISTDNITYNSHGSSITFGGAVSGNDQTVSITSETGLQARYLRIFIRSGYLPGSGGWSGSVNVTRATWETQEINGDAFYTWSDISPASAYGSGDGLTINASVPTSVPSYNAGHEYYIQETVSSGPVDFDFESPYPLTGMENWSQQIYACFLGV